jgi:two-component system response regulator DesR
MILIADDNNDVRRMLRSLVEDLDPEIIECPNGQEAVAKYEELEPDLVLMDISMQPVDGLTATQKILERFPAARIIIVTEHQDPRIRKKSIEIGAIGFVGKDDLMSLREFVEKPVSS